MPKEGRSPKRPTRPRTKSARAAQQARDESDAEKLVDTAPSEEAGFTPRTLDRSVIAIPLLNILGTEDEQKKKDKSAKVEPHHVVIDLHLEFPGGREKARDRVQQLIEALPARADGTRPRLRWTTQYTFATLYGDEIRALVRLDR